MSQSGIYTIENTANGHLYVGSAVDFSGRRRAHLHHLRRGKHHSAYLQRAFNKYGEDAFVFRLIEETLRDRDILFERESYWLQTLRPQYNHHIVQANALGYKHSEATKQKFREVQRRPEIIAAKRAARLGKKQPPEVRKKISKSLTGKKVSEKARQTLAYYRQTLTPEQRKGMTGKRHSEATRQSMRNAVTEEMRRFRSEMTKDLWSGRSKEERQRIVDATHSEEATRKRSEASRAMWQDEGHRHHISEASKEAWQDEELRRNQSETMKAMWAERSEEERRKYIEPTLTEEARQNRSKASQSMWDKRSEEERRQVTEGMRGKEALRKRSETVKAKWTDEKRSQRGEESKAMWADRSPEERRQATSALRTEEVNRRRAETLREVWRKKKEATALALQGTLFDDPGNAVSH